MERTGKIKKKAFKLIIIGGSLTATVNQEMVETVDREIR